MFTFCVLGVQLYGGKVSSDPDSEINKGLLVGDPHSTVAVGPSVVLKQPVSPSNAILINWIQRLWNDDHDTNGDQVPYNIDGGRAHEMAPFGKM